MKDSTERDALAAKRARNEAQRVEKVKQWAEYIDSTPVEEWGPQHTQLVNDQLAAARSAELSADHYRRVRAAGEQFERHRDDDS